MIERYWRLLTASDTQRYNYVLLMRSTMWHDLSQPFHEEMPRSSALPAPEFETLLDIDEDGANIQYYSVPTHIGTHVDAPLHIVQGGRSIDEFPLDRFYGEGVIVDVSTDAPEEIDLADVEEAPGDVREGDIVIFYTGWASRYGEDDYDPHPWLADEVAEWLIDMDIPLIGVDTITPDLPGPKRPEGWDAFPIHRSLLGAEVLIAEHLGNLEPLAGSRVEIQALPIPIAGGDGAPARIVARPV